MDNIYIKLDELFDLLDNLDCIKNIEYLKNNINNKTLNLINEYRLNNNPEIKKELFKDEFYLNFIKNEQELNYIILNINKIFRSNNENN